jgi:hypothetical protein
MLNQTAMFALQGPPGTGKTEVTSQAVADYLKHEPGARVLVSAQSHDALENLAVRILDKLQMTSGEGRKAKLDRLALRVMSKGTHREVDPRMSEFLPENLTDGVIKYSATKAKEWLATRRTENPKMIPVVQDWITSLPNTRIELGARIRKGTNIMFATTGMATKNNLAMDDEPFDWVLVEEAARAWPTELAMPLVRGVRWTLVGDHAQIGAYSRGDVERFLQSCENDPDEELRSMYEARHGYAKAFGTFENLFDDSVPSAPRMVLSQQYRMHQDIASLVGQSFYSESGGLETCRPESPHPLRSPFDLLGTRLIWIDTGQVQRAAGYWSNEYEADLTAKIVRGMQPSPSAVDGESPSLAILTPYRDQLRLLERRITERIPQIFTIDGFQGREADIIVASLVRDTPGRAGTPISSVGHLASAPRINVLLSRARELLVIVGRFDVYAKHAGPRWEEITTHFAKFGSVVSASEWIAT